MDPIFSIGTPNTDVIQRIGSEMNGEDGAVGSAGSVQWSVVNAGREVDTVAADLWAKVQPLVSGGVRAPIGKLWTDRLL